MKKYLYSIFAAVLAVGCTSFEEEQPLAVETVDAPTITVVKVEDTSVTATITAVEGTSFYSYAVIAGKAAELDATTLFKLGYKSKAFANGTVNFSKTPAFELVAGTAEKPLVRDADYTIYAVAASEQGTIGEVVYKEFHTSDADAPKIGGATGTGNVMALKFSEKVTYDSSKPATAKYYAVNLMALNGDKSALASDGLIGDAKAVVELAADGKSANVTVTLEDGSPLPNGAYYAVSYPEGAFKDNVGNVMAGLTSGPGVKDGKITLFGAMGHIDNKPFALVPEVEDQDVITDLTEPILYNVPEGVTLAKADSKLKGTITYEGESYKTQYEAACFGLMSATQIGIMPYVAGLNAPARGEYISLAVPEKYLTDIYGNTSDAITLGPLLFSYGYTLEDDVIGTYANDGKSGYGAKYDEDPWTFTIAASDDASKGNVMITKWYGRDAKIYGTFDTDRGILEMPIYYQELQPMLTMMGEDVVVVYWYTFAYNSCSQKKKNTLQMLMSTSGQFTDGNDAPGYYYEIYYWPESNDPNDIDEDNDFVTYDYNIFDPIFEKQAPAPAPEAVITIDGDMSDWAAIEGTVREPDSGNAIAEVKGYVDDDNVYVYVKRAKIGRWSELWGGDSTNAGYYYYDFELDNNTENGIAENSHGNYDSWCYLYLFGGSSTEPVFRSPAPGSAKNMSIDNVTINGVVTDDAVEVEASFPRTDLAEITADIISISCWGNKDGNPVTTVTVPVNSAAALTATPSRAKADVTRKKIVR